MQPALFLDRDGVIIENCEGYVRSWADVAFIPGALGALTRLSASPYPIVILTNQSVIGRGMITPEQAEAINQGILQVIRQHRGRVDAVYVCPHAPQDQCACRKPEPGLFFHAAADLAIDLTRSIIIGDAYSDLLSGQRAGLAHTALLRTGRGEDQLRQPAPADLKPFLTFDSLRQAVDHYARFLLPSEGK